MIFANSGFITLALNGAIFIVAGIIMSKNPPRAINAFYGYRTPRSRKSQAHWDFAQRYSSRMMSRIGQVLVILSVPFAFLNVNRSIVFPIALVIIGLSVVVLIVFTERAIREKFGNN